MAAGEAAELQDLSTYVGNVIEALIPLIGIISFVMVLAGGFTILTAGGNPESIKKGGQTITFAIGGLVLSIIAWLILVLIKNITGVDLTQFKFHF
ncbi:MAG: hypothetical protein ABII80_02320 [bacterium]